MPKRIAASTLNASTLDILNVIRENASYEYQQNVPKITKATDIPKVGEVIYGTPAFANQFINALVNRIALVRVNSATFNNPYSRLKKGYLEFGETVENVFVNIAKVVEYDAEKAEAREFKRNLPDVRSAFHVMNWRVLYPVTIQDSELKLAFLSAEGVFDLIAKIVDQVYTAAEYDEFLLFKYLLIKAISHGQIGAVKVIGDGDMEDSAIHYRGYSNLLPFLSPDYNEAGVLTNTPKSKQVIFMDAMYNARYDVSILASAFNMDKADFMGRIFLIDKWDSFDNHRFETIREASDGLEEVKPAELALLKNVKAVLLDEDWFQIYDNKNKFTEKYVASGDYWNYFYHVWKTISHSPFSNAVVFSTDEALLPDAITVEIRSKDTSEEGVAMALVSENEASGLQPHTINFKVTEAMAGAGIGITKYGALYIPASQTATEITLVGDVKGVEYTAATAITSSSNVGATVTMNKTAAASSTMGARVKK